MSWIAVIAKAISTVSSLPNLRPFRNDLKKEPLPPIYRVLPENDWMIYRFQIKGWGDANKRIYTIGQIKKTGAWKCSCWKFKNKQTCNHLDSFGFPGKGIPYFLSDLELIAYILTKTPINK